LLTSCFVHFSVPVELNHNDTRCLLLMHHKPSSERVGRFLIINHGTGENRDIGKMHRGKQGLQNSKRAYRLELLLSNEISTFAKPPLYNTTLGVHMLPRVPSGKCASYGSTGTMHGMRDKVIQPCIMFPGIRDRHYTSPVPRSDTDLTWFQSL
jgi:hypothetical protein